MTNIKDLKQIYHGPVAQAAREKREMAYNEKLLEEKKARREKAIVEVDKIILLCKEAAENGYTSCMIEEYISDEVSEILSEKEIKHGREARQSGGKSTFFGWAQ